MPSKKPVGKWLSAAEAGAELGLTEREFETEAEKFTQLLPKLPGKIGRPHRWDRRVIKAYSILRPYAGGDEEETETVVGK
jgi:hypothetical protein